MAILVLVLLLASLHPNKAPFAVAVILAVLVAVPYVDERIVRRLGVAAWLTSVVIGLLDALTPVAGGIPGPVGAGLRLFGLAAASGITLLAIGHLSARLRGLVLRYRGLFDRVPVGVYRTTPDGRFLDVNRAFATMLGYDAPDELRERAAADLYAEPGQRERFRAALEADDSVREIELRVRRRDGTAIWIRDSANLVRDRAGRPLYCEGVIQDVTEIALQLAQDLPTIHPGQQDVVVDERGDEDQDEQDPDRERRGRLDQGRILPLRRVSIGDWRGRRSVATGRRWRSRSGSPCTCRPGCLPGRRG